jgi:mRNA interferase RelE/StbE
MFGPARYTVFLKPAAERALKKIAQPTLHRIAKAIDNLGNDPRPSGATALQGESGLLRIRVGDYRIIYSIDDTVLTVLVVAIGHRREVYQRR